MKKSLKYVFPILFIMSCGTDLKAQIPVNSGIQKQIEQGQFTFVANSASPLRGRTRFLDASYDVKLGKDTVASYLPYFGVAEQPPLSSDEAGIRFTSTKFEYSFTQRNKGGWNVQVLFKDQSATRQFNFIVFENGNATLDVTSNFRDPISFKGDIKKE